MLAFKKQQKLSLHQHHDGWAASRYYPGDNLRMAHSNNRGVHLDVDDHVPCCKEHHMDTLASGLRQDGVAMSD
jgi:hypothetical protein